MVPRWLRWMLDFLVRPRMGSRPSAREPTLGKRGEEYAARFLRQRGYRILPHDPRREFAEIDLIAVDHDTIVFVEVKTRASWHAGSPLEAIDHRKRLRLTLAALGFLKRHRLLDQRARFDVIGLTWPPEQDQPIVHHVKNAFEAEGRGQMFR